MKKKRLAVVLAAVMTVVLLGGCGGKSTETNENGGTNTPQETQENSEKADNTSSQGERSKTASIAFGEMLVRLDPHDQANVPGKALNDMVFDTLLASDRQGNYSERLATSWETSEDGTEMTFTLREGVKFHNGEDFNADDVVCTFQRLIDTPSLTEVSNYWGTLTGVEKIDDYTVKLIFSEKSVAPMLGLCNTAIIPNEAYEEMGSSLFTDQIMTGCGPWKFVEWVDGQYAKFEKFEDYWGGNDSYFDEVYMRQVAEPSSAISAQVTGEIDGYYLPSGISADMLPLYDGYETTCEIITVDPTVIDYLGFQCGEGSVFADPDVRRAFSMAIDRQGIIDGLLGGGTKITGIFPESCMGYDEKLSSEYYDYDLEAAKALLETTGYKGEEITISSVSSFNNIALAICDMVNAIGFNCKAEVVETATLGDIRSTGEYDAFIVTAFMINCDPHQFTSLRILADVHTSEYENAEMSELLSNASKELDAEKRNDMLQQANAIIADGCAPMISLAQLQTRQSLNYGITGVDFTPDGYCFFRNIDYDASLLK